MILRTITVHNYRSYCGENRLDLPEPNPDAPIHLIGGLNGFGKTTLLNAIKACLFAHPDRPILRAQDVSLSASAATDIQISLEFHHEGQNWQLTRRWIPRASRGKASQDSMTLESLLHNRSTNETTREEDEIFDLVEAILPESISAFFLFDGEEIQSYADSLQSGEKVREALERLLGIQLYDRLRNDLDRVEDLLKQDRKGVDVQDELRHKEDRCDQIRQRLKAIVTERDQLRKSAAEADKDLKRLGRELEEVEHVLDPDTCAAP